MRLLFAVSIALPALAASAACNAEGLADPPKHQWTGFYVGGHVGNSNGRANGELSEPQTTASRNGFGSLYGGVHAGYNRLLPAGIPLGAEADISFPNYFGADDVVWDATGAKSHVTEKVDYVASVRGRVGRAFGPWLIYGTGGYAWSSGRFVQSPSNIDDEDTRARLRSGWVLGGGVERAFDRDWTVRLEYLSMQFGTAGVTFHPDTRYQSTFDTHTVRVGLSRRLGAASNPDDAPTKEATPAPGSRWEIHGQTTYIHQGYPSFSALYTGENSLTPKAQAKQTWSNSAFLGVRLWSGGELYYNPELLQGFGLSSTVGAGGFPNGEAQKSDFLYPHYNTSRLFLRQTFGLGGEQETVESDYGQMAGKRDVSRLTVQVGKFAVHDVFDNNAYAQDPRTDFLNWSIWAAGAFDYPADKLGLTWGAVVDYNQKYWASRIGYFLVGDRPNSNTFDMALFRRGGYVGELETRYRLFSAGEAADHGLAAQQLCGQLSRGRRLDACRSGPRCDRGDRADAHEPDQVRICSQRGAGHHR